MNMGALEGQQRMLDPLELDPLETELMSSGRAVYTLNHWVVSLSLLQIFSSSVCSLIQVLFSAMKSTIWTSLNISFNAQVIDIQLFTVVLKWKKYLKSLNTLAEALNCYYNYSNRSIHWFSAQLKYCSLAMCETLREYRMKSLNVMSWPCLKLSYYFLVLLAECCHLCNLLNYSFCSLHRKTVKPGPPLTLVGFSEELTTGKNMLCTWIC